MSATPITDALTVLRYALYAALSPLYPAVYWLRAEQDAPLPFVVYQPQDGGGRGVPYLGEHGWAGLVAVKALAETPSAGEALFATVAPGMALLSAAGHRISAAWDRPLSIPPDGDIWQCGGLWRVTID